ncbi:MAG TPA: hypothetical protein DEP72_02620 [Clostridiales bacterium]|nr:MAG: hypothetical protein A2Y18_06565 [Clostridiales bacterium GWD2_32_19]HCC07048.1 hypothetical protein [Clostridiales bacterium]
MNDQKSYENGCQNNNNSNDLNKSLIYLIVYFFIGLLFYPLINSFFITKYICTMIAVTIHELGHTVVGLLYGNLSFPFVDFFLGRGGITVSIEGSPSGVIFGVMALVVLIYIFRERYYFIGMFVFFIIILLCTAFTPQKYILISMAGHLFEAIFVGVALYMSIVAEFTNIYDRPFYSMLAWWTALNRIDLFNGLQSSELARSQYIENSIVSPDLLNITNSLGLPGIESIAGYFMLIYVIPIIIIVIMAVYKIFKQAS